MNPKLVFAWVSQFCTQIQWKAKTLIFTTEQYAAKRAKTNPGKEMIVVNLLYSLILKVSCYHYTLHPFKTLTHWSGEDNKVRNHCLVPWFIITHGSQKADKVTKETALIALEALYRPIPTQTWKNNWERPSLRNHIVNKMSFIHVAENLGNHIKTSIIGARGVWAAYEYGNFSQTWEHAHLL